MTDNICTFYHPEYPENMRCVKVDGFCPYDGDEVECSKNVSDK
jgi:hypothetical protein